MQRNILRWTGGTASVLAAWALLMLALPFVGPAGRQVAVVGDRAGAFRAIAAAGGQVLEARGVAVLARSDRPGFARRLYREGAPLVLEGRIGAGCFSRKA